jgi:hypothetical protein
LWELFFSGKLKKDSRKLESPKKDIVPPLLVMMTYVTFHIVSHAGGIINSKHVTKISTAVVSQIVLRDDTMAAAVKTSLYLT